METRISRRSSCHFVCNIKEYFPVSHADYKVFKRQLVKTNIFMRTVWKQTIEWLKTWVTVSNISTFFWIFQLPWSSQKGFPVQPHRTCAWERYQSAIVVLKCFSWPPIVKSLFRRLSILWLSLFMSFCTLLCMACCNMWQICLMLYEVMVKCPN